MPTFHLRFVAVLALLLVSPARAVAEPMEEAIGYAGGWVVGTLHPSDNPRVASNPGLRVSMLTHKIRLVDESGVVPATIATIGMCLLQDRNGPYRPLAWNPEPGAHAIVDVTFGHQRGGTLLSPEAVARPDLDAWFWAVSATDFWMNRHWDTSTLRLGIAAEVTGFSVERTLSDLHLNVMLKLAWETSPLPGVTFSATVGIDPIFGPLALVIFGDHGFQASAEATAAWEPTSFLRVWAAIAARTTASLDDQQANTIRPEAGVALFGRFGD